MALIDGMLRELEDEAVTTRATTRAAMLRSIMLNHWYHHRGQLTVYLRELGVPIPAIYGPSADEQPRPCGAASAGRLPNDPI